MYDHHQHLMNRSQGQGVNERMMPYPYNPNPGQQHPSLHPNPYYFGNGYLPNQHMVNQHYYGQWSHPNYHHSSPFNSYAQSNDTNNVNSQTLFQNPLQPEPNNQLNASHQMNGYYSMNPYPKLQSIQKPTGGLHSVMNSFKGQDGSIDFNKMVNTAGNMMNAVTQVSSVVKGFSSIFKV